MQYSFVTLATLIAAVAAQNGASGVPACAATCVTQLPAGCQAQDIGCICGNSEFITNVSCCVSKSCTGADQAAALQFAQQICQAGGVTLTVTGATCIGSATSSAASSTRPASAGAGSVSTTSTGTAAPTSTNTSAGTVAATTASTTRISSGGAAQATAMAGYLGAAIAAAAFL